MSSGYDDMLRNVFAGRAFEAPDEDVSVHAGRELFFRAVHRVKPEVVKDLMGEPLTLFRPLFEAYLAQVPKDRRPWWHTFEKFPPWGWFKYASERDATEVHQLRELLLKWANRWRLWAVNSDDDWCLEAAVETLAILSAAGDQAEPQPLHYLGSRMIDIPFSDVERRFSFSCAGWNPTLESWQVAEEWLDEGYAQAKKAYKERLDQAARERGLEPVRGSRHRKGDHFEWLVRYQVGRERWAWIAKEESARLKSEGDPDGVSAGAVAKAATEKARLIGLKLADRRPGRPPASPGSQGKTST